MQNSKIFFVGAGNMGGAIIRGLLNANYKASSILFFEPSDTIAKNYEEQGLIRTKNFKEGYTLADVIFLCVKPQIFSKLPSVWKSEFSIPETEPLPDLASKKIISIMAGVKRKSLTEALGNGEILRVMPNLPLTVGKGTVALATDGVSEETLTVAEEIFKTIATTCRVQESAMDAVTGLSGSAPAYVFEFIEGLVRGGVQAGLSRDVALKLALGTIEGSVALVKETGESPADLCAKVCSPAGTTIAGIKALEKAAFRSAIISAIEAGTNRSKELG